MGILDGKRILVAGVTMDSSIGFATAQGRAGAGRDRADLQLRPRARHHPADRQAAARASRRCSSSTSPTRSTSRGCPSRCASTSTASTASCTRSPTATPRRCSAASSSTGPWADVAQAVQVSAYSLKSLAEACRPLMGAGGSVVGLTFDATVAWPAYDWMGVAKAGAGVLLALPRPRPRPQGIRVNLVSAGPLKTLAAKAIPGFEELEDMWSDPGAARLGQHRPDADRAGRRARCCPTSSRPPPARSCTSTAASTRWGPDRYRSRVPSSMSSALAWSSCGSSRDPNLYFPRAAIKLTLDISGLAAASEETAARFARRIGLRDARPGAADSGFRQRFAARAVARLVRAVAAESGTARLAVRVRPTSDPHRLVVAYPWRHRERAQVMGRAVAEVLDALPGRRRRGRGEPGGGAGGRGRAGRGAAHDHAAGARSSRSPAPTARPRRRG